MGRDAQIDLPPLGRLIEVNGFYCVRFGKCEFGDWANTEQKAVKLAWDAWEVSSGITKDQLRGMLGAVEFVQDFARYSEITSLSPDVIVEGKASIT